MANKLELDVKTKVGDDIVEACCVLHNVVRRKDGIRVEDEYLECSQKWISLIGLWADSTDTEVRDHFNITSGTIFAVK